jgi:cytochrome c-type biogenesis protein CcmH/NrfF
MEPTQFDEMLVDAVLNQFVTAVTLFPQWAHEQPILWLLPIGIIAGLVRKARPTRRRRRSAR